MIMVGISQKGDKTHHHDQVITLHSFRTIKATPSIAGSPIEAEFDLLVDIWIWISIFSF